MVTNGDYTYRGDQFAIHTNVETLCCTHETNRILYVSNTSVKKNLLHCLLFFGVLFFFFKQRERESAHARAHTQAEGHRERERISNRLHAPHGAPSHDHNHVITT